MDRQDSKDQASSPVDSTDGSALPATVNWATKNFSSRRPSLSTSAAASSPQVLEAVPTPQATEIIKGDVVKSAPTTVEAAMNTQPEPIEQETSMETNIPTGSSPPPSPLTAIRKMLQSGGFSYVFDESLVSQRDLELIKNYPSLIDPHGGSKRAAFKEREAREAEMLRKEQEAQAVSAQAQEVEEVAEGGSLQLGGEPEEQRPGAEGQQHPVRSLSRNTVSSQNYGTDRAYSPANPMHAIRGTRALSEQQRQQMLLQQLKSASPQGHGSYSQQAQSAMYAQGMLPSGGIGHARQTSRFLFSNEASAAPSSVKPNTNPKIMNQQSAMMPPNLSQYGQHSNSTPYFTSGVQGPPPGLKATGTPPVSGGGMFGQGHGFTTAGLSYGANPAGRAAGDEMMRELFRNRGASAGSGQASDAGRRESNISCSHLGHPKLNGAISQSTRVGGRMRTNLLTNVI